MRYWITILLLLIATTTTVGAPVSSYQEHVYLARDRVLPALVHIQPVVEDYQTGELKKQAVVGSGVIFHPDGYIVTNYHVAGKALRIICTLNDREELLADYVGGDPSTDIAVLKLRLQDYTGEIAVAKLGDSDSIQVGQQVLAMGSPLSLARSVSAGVISTKDRYFSSDYRLPSGEKTGRYNLWIQTDAAINFGNSGGPLVDLSGRVIGINSRATFMANNLGFAIPINVVKEVTRAILEGGEVPRSWIGVHAQAMQELENYFGTDRNTGVLIASIDPGSPAEEAFLKAGDIVLQINDQSVSARFVEELPAFYNWIARVTPGSKLKLTILRGEETYSFEVTTRPLGQLQGEDYECSDWGFTVRNITHQMQLSNQLRDSVGVLVTGVRRIGPADLGGLNRGDVLKSVIRVPITGLPDLIEQYNRLTDENPNKLLLTVNRNGAIRLIVLDLEKGVSQGDK
ncbi:MAG: trypsin-like peptidase domain-containing protein [candidate division Zixibacteria bacterium]|nr:trypsin-like peptidase domain-containing protein [candidate division Zixibacteria bacterium]